MRFLGHEFVLTTAAPQEEVEEVINLVQSQLAKLMHPSSKLISEKAAILTCLNLAGDYVRLKREYEQAQLAQGARVGRLTKRIESYLDML
ncbi:MAG: cell division protein ZapA [Thermodesulfobacteriota bacterium]